MNSTRNTRAFSIFSNPDNDHKVKLEIIDFNQMKYNHTQEKVHPQGEFYIEIFDLF